MAAFSLRFYGLSNNYPFWVDEFGTATQAKKLLEGGIGVVGNKEVVFESHNLTTHFLVALFFKLLGQKEWIARLPFAIIGSFLPLAVFLLTKKISDFRTALSSMILAAFSFIEILWSRQARGYVLLQLLIILSFYFYLLIFSGKRPEKHAAFLFFLTTFLGILTHFMFVIALLALFIHFLIFNRRFALVAFKSFWFYLAAFVFIFIMYKTGALRQILIFPSTSFFRPNNLWYYHSFLWREYNLITFLGFFGLLLAFLRNRIKIYLIFIFILLQLIFVNFIFSPYHSRYLLPIFPLLFIGMAYTISYLANSVSLKSRSILTIVITLFIILNGDKFVFKPKAYYSLNRDFREIANIDYHQVYEIIKKKYNKEKQIAIIETWPARTYWYIDSNFKPLYHFRWQDEEGFALGMPKKTNYFLNNDGEKMLTKNLGFVGTLADFISVRKKYPKGFIFIDDSSLPKDILDYAEKNLKKELYLDHYPLDDNPYSIWPATLFSWGLN